MEEPLEPVKTRIFISIYCQIFWNCLMSFILNVYILLCRWEEIVLVVVGRLVEGFKLHYIFGFKLCADFNLLAWFPFTASGFALEVQVCCHPHKKKQSDLVRYPFKIIFLSKALHRPYLWQRQEASYPWQSFKLLQDFLMRKQLYS